MCVSVRACVRMCVCVCSCVWNVFDIYCNTKNIMYHSVIIE